MPTPRKAVVNIDGVRILYYSVSKGLDYIHLTADGRCLRRIDRDSVPESTESISTNRLEDRSRRWDREIEESATLNDLDLDLIQSVAGQIAYGVSAEKCLQYLELAEFSVAGLRLKRAAVMLFAKDIRKWHPRCQVRILTYRGIEPRSGENYNVVKDDSVSECILKLIDRAWERLTVALSQHTTVTDRARFEQSLLYPQTACREALINAIVHRNYAIDGRGIEVSIFQDRMEILSPGMLLSTISLADIKDRKGVHESRNPYIARVLREVGFIREMGEGIRRIYDVMRSSSLAEPAFENTTNGFAVTLYNKSLYDPAIKLWLSNYEAHKLSENHTATVALGFGGRRFSTQDVVDRIGIVDTDEVREILTPLVHRGLIRRALSPSQAHNEARRLRIPKREVKVWEVVSPVPTQAGISERGPASRANTQQVKPNDSAEPDPSLRSDLIVDGMVSETLHQIYIGNLHYSANREHLTELISNHCEIVALQVPPGRYESASNRGFAFATVSYDGTMEELLSKLDGIILLERRVVVQRQTPNIKKG